MKINLNILDDADDYADAECLDEAQLLKSPQLEELLKKVGKSLNLSVRTEAIYNEAPSTSDVFVSGLGKAKHGASWKDRVEFWASGNSTPEYWFFIRRGTLHFVDIEDIGEEWIVKDAIKYTMLPIFPHYGFDVKKFLAKCKENPTIINGSDLANSFYAPNAKPFSISQGNKNMFDKLASRMTQVNQEAAKTTAQLSVGRAANQTLRSALAQTFPWYARLMGQHKQVVDNPFARLATAEMVAASVAQFQPDNKKLQYVADAMVTEAMSEVVLNSEMFKGVINQLEGLAKNLPSFATEKQE